MRCLNCKGTVFTFSKREDYSTKLRGLDVLVPKASFWGCAKCKATLVTSKLVKDIVNTVVQEEARRNDCYPHMDVPDFLPAEDSVCCERMFGHMTQNMDCGQHGYSCPDRGVSYHSDGTYTLRAANANYSMNFCPWCAASLPRMQ
jgi:hypothetical protein